MMCEIVKATVPNVNERLLGFPCWSDEKGKRDKFRQTSVDKLSPEITSLVEAWEPYPDGRSRLFVLSELDNLDKHRAIIPTMTGAEYSEGAALFAHMFDGQECIDPFPAKKGVHEGQCLCCGRSAIMPPVGPPVQAKAGLALDGLDSVKGRDLLGELSAHIGIVGSVLRSFETGEPPVFLPPPPLQPVQTGPNSWQCPPGMSDKEIRNLMQAKMNDASP
jgi:hypothetical protein